METDASRPIVIYLVQGNAVQKVLPEIEDKIDSGKCFVCLYYYVQEKNEIQMRETLEAMQGLHFEIVADEKAIYVKNPEAVVTAECYASNKVCGRFKEWLTESGIASTCIRLHSVPQMEN